MKRNVLVSFRHLFILLTVASFVTFTSCGGDEGGGDDPKKTDEEGPKDDGTNASDAELLKKMKDLSLKEQGLNMSIKVPEVKAADGSDFPVNVTAGEDGITWQISIGSAYHIHIEDMDGMNASVADAKEEHTNSDVFEYEYLVDEPSHLLYKQFLSEAKAGDTFEYYHTYVIINVGGIDYKIVSDNAGEYRELHARKMMVSALSLQMMPGA